MDWELLDQLTPKIQALTRALEAEVEKRPVPDPDDSREPRWEKRKPIYETKWRSSRSACGRVLKSCLTSPTLLEMAIYRQLTVVRDSL